MMGRCLRLSLFEIDQCRNFSHFGNSLPRLATIQSNLCVAGRRTGMSALEGIRWVRVLIGGLLAEVAVFAVVVPLSFALGQRSLFYTAPVASLVACFLLAWWVGRGVGSRFVLHGALVGVVATLIYIALTRAQPEPFAYVVAHVLKILGGGAGGFVAMQVRGMDGATKDPNSTAGTDL